MKNKIERRTKVKSKVKILIWASILVLVQCFLFCTWGCKKEMDKARKHYELGVQYHKQAFSDPNIEDSQKQELAEKAIKELREAVKINPNYAEAHYELGVLYDEKEDHAGAAQELQKAININPNYADAHFRLGILYQALRGYDQTLSQFEEVLRINPNFPRIHTAMGNVYYERGVRTWGKAIKLDWSYLLPDTLKEIAYKNKDELRKAIESYINTTEFDTTNAAAYAKLSQAYYTWAQDEYQKAIAVDPSDTIAQLQLGLTFLERGYQNKAMNQSEALKKLDPRAADLLLQEIQHKEQEEMELKRRGLRK
jgi:tetratricopeptide (TPR) repeat protein